ncbi:uncharacterized protein BDR25DRAFT_354311 [Lindgomyces ingoldianus]|uniref:Uncharacterized protein n=1 Tax=Lindgomyces ingoldianus TaxID=673940 RepID=A0ACB6R043_9PLEO|nr:uncharacterized protein BDR25DRAFT_354311 [Lindgomyces ingoldianus]KAF2471816.1 hypothetical protein BDR25DRAFT_354311 [Lindgomyces ingoldianus]
MALERVRPRELWAIPHLSDSRFSVRTGLRTPPPLQQKGLNNQLVVDSLIVTHTLPNPLASFNALAIRPHTNHRIVGYAERFKELAAQWALITGTLVVIAIIAVRTWNGGFLGDGNRSRAYAE